TARRAAWRFGEVPWITRDPGEWAVSHAFPPKLGRRRLAEHDSTVLAQASDGRRIITPWSLRIDRLRSSERRPPAREQQVLDRDGHSIELTHRLAAHPPRFRLFSLRERFLGGDEAKRVEHRIRRFDPAQNCMGHIDWRDAPGTIESKQIDSGQPGKIRRHFGRA